VAILVGLGLLAADEAEAQLLPTLLCLESAFSLVTAGREV
jgi:hypothetical protein